MASQLLHALLPVVILFAGIMGGASNQSRHASSLDGHAPVRWRVVTWGHELSNLAPDGALAWHD
jgi:hypothetical protein